ncbi:MAG: methylenetetrahydrofolate reductase [NAD(P)H] [Armatimonadetes bacterium]|nr:methylenetetrahydrofolate reductase [NAD(P)H] [Armatimonadota bacterium]MDE2205164.1 methylenetetrahydrofolate reductase [NAD(P)H] [Armatimonadota bacterium]
MHIHDIFAAQTTTFSFEFSPPKTDDAAGALFAAIRRLERLQPSFVSVTYGAGGSTRGRTQDLVVRIKRETSCDAVPHLTCVCHSEADIRAMLQRYAENGISNLHALGGDVPLDRAGYDRGQDAFRYATDLVAYIRRFNESGVHPDRRGFGIGVAGFPEGHPATPNRLLEMDYLKAKVDAGADYIVTQLFFDNRDFFDFRERCQLAGINVPIIAGLMPVTSMQGLKRMAELALGCRFPARLIRLLNRCADDDGIRRAGVHWATEQCRDLLDGGVRGIHFYTLNRSHATTEIYAGLGVQNSRQLLEPRAG